MRFRQINRIWRVTRASPSILLLASLEDSDRGVRVGRGRGGIIRSSRRCQGRIVRGTGARFRSRRSREKKKKKMREKREMKNERKKREGCVGKQIKESGERGEGGRGRGGGKGDSGIREIETVFFICLRILEMEKE